MLCVESCSVVQPWVFICLLHHHSILTSVCQSNRDWRNGVCILNIVSWGAFAPYRENFASTVVEELELSSSSSTIVAGSGISLKNPDAVCTVLSSWWWAEDPPETCRAFCRNKWYIYKVASCWLCLGIHLLYTDLRMSRSGQSSSMILPAKKSFTLLLRKTSYQSKYLPKMLTESFRFI
jgi:hypothetical protein